MSALSGRWGGRVSLAGIWLLAFGLRAGAGAEHARGEWIHVDEPAYLATATTLGTQHLYLTDGHGAPEIVRGPAYPAFLAALFALAGGPSVPAALLVQAGLGATSCLLLALQLARGAGPLLPGRADRRHLAAWAALALALSPIAVLYDRVLMSESLASFLLAVVLVCWLRLHEAQALSPHAGWLAALALSHAALALTKPSFLPLLAVLTTIEALARRTPRNLGRGLCAVALSVALVTPWTARNWRVSGAFVPIGAGGGVFLFLGTVPPGRYGVTRPPEEAAGVVAEYLAATTAPARKVQIDRELRKRAWTRIAERPGAFAFNAAARVSRMWVASHASAIVAPQHVAGIPRAVRAALAASAGGLVILAAAGALLLVRRRAVDQLAWIAVPVYLTLVHAPLAAGARYAVPVWPGVVCLAALAVFVFAARRRRPAGESVAPAPEAALARS